MNPILKKVLVILVILVVLGYTILNYYAEKSDMPMFLVSLGLLSYFLVSMVASLVEDLREK